MARAAAVLQAEEASCRGRVAEGACAVDELWQHIGVRHSPGCPLLRWQKAVFWQRESDAMSGRRSLLVGPPRSTPLARCLRGLYRRLSPAGFVDVGAGVNLVGLHLLRAVAWGPPSLMSMGRLWRPA